VGTSLREQLEHYRWSFLNHACEPNAAFRGLTLVATRAIRQGEEITFHYATTEYDMAEPFRCRCGSPLCLGEIRGFRHLPPAALERLRRMVRTAPARRADRGWRRDSQRLTSHCGFASLPRRLLTTPDELRLSQPRSRG
jgi:hypothetical protein